MKNIIKFLKNIFIKNWTLKLISLCLAILLWYYIVGSETIEFTYSVPVSFINLPEKLAFEGNEEEYQVKITVKGTRSAVSNRELNEFKVLINLFDAVVGKNTITIKPQDISTPRGVEVIYFTPSTLEIRLDNKMTKTVNLDLPVIIGKPAKNYTIKNIQLSTKMKIIEGPASLLKNINTLNLEPVNIDNLNDSFEKEIGLIVPDKNIKIHGSSKVKISIKFEEATAEKIRNNYEPDTDIK